MNEVSNLFVVAMGLGTVFVGLISIIFISKIMSFFCTKFAKINKSAAPTVKPVAPANSAPVEIANKQEFVAAVSAVIAEQLGCGVEGIRIKSIKRI